MIKKTFQIIFNLEFMKKKYLKKTFEKYKSKNKFKLNNTYLKKYLDILKKSQKTLN